jgi:Uncharacterised protein family (UPF0236)
LKEHYGITIPNSAARDITECHAQKISRMSEAKSECPEADVVIAECDGSMIPIVETFVVENCGDRRKHKTLLWKEGRLSLAHAKGSVTPVFSATLESVEIAGQQLLSCVNRAGATEKTKVHCVGDGAVWIANQVEEQFGANGTYLIDFYHLCEYLGAAAPKCSPENPTAWIEAQKAALKLSRHQEVLWALRPFLEAANVPELEAPVRACYRYIKNRSEQLDYKSALEKDLPIGSGEVESAHRYVLQKRLKLPGAWWALPKAKDMIGLRVCRANNHWERYWAQVA